jgi:hypothetical protein
MNNPLGGLMSQVIGAIAERLAADPRIPVENREAYRQTVRSVIEAELSRLFPGEQLRMYIPKFGSAQRKERDERIAAAIAAGEAPDDIAKRESITVRHVRRLRGRIGG